MKAILAITALLVLGATAQSKVAPLESAASVIASSNWATVSRSSAAQMESDYFREPQSPPANDILPCRLQHIIFEKARLAQSCR